MQHKWVLISYIDVSLITSKETQLMAFSVENIFTSIMKWMQNYLLETVIHFPRNQWVKSLVTPDWLIQETSLQS